MSGRSRGRGGGFNRYLNNRGVWMEIGLQLYGSVADAVRDNRNWFDSQPEGRKHYLEETSYGIMDENTAVDFDFDVIEENLRNPKYISFNDVIGTFKRMFNESY